MSTTAPAPTSEKLYGLVWVDSVVITETQQDVEPLPLDAAKQRVREYNRLGRTSTGWYEVGAALEEVAA